MDDKESAPRATTLDRGFEVIVDFLAQAGRTTADEADWPLLSSRVALAELIAVLRPVLRLPSPPEYPPTAEVPPIPILKAATGFELPQPSTSDGLAPLASAAAPLKLQIPSSPSNAPDGAVTPLSGLEISSPPLEPGTTSPAATLVVDLLAQHVTHGIVSRHTRQASSLTPTLAQFASSDPSLQPLRLVLDAGATDDGRSQVVFRTLLIKEALRRLSRASSTPVVASRVSALVEVVTSLTIQGASRAFSFNNARRRPAVRRVGRRCPSGSGLCPPVVGEAARRNCAGRLARARRAHRLPVLLPRSPPPRRVRQCAPGLVSKASDAATAETACSIPPASPRRSTSSPRTSSSPSRHRTATKPRRDCSSTASLASCACRSTLAPRSTPSSFSPCSGRRTWTQYFAEARKTVRALLQLTFREWGGLIRAHVHRFARDFRRHRRRRGSTLCPRSSLSCTPLTAFRMQDESQLLDILDRHDEQLARLDSPWLSVLVEESARGHAAVVAELKRMQDLAAQLKQKRDSHRRRLRKRRRSISDWKSSVQEQDGARAAHVRQLPLLAGCASR